MGRGLCNEVGWVIHIQNEREEEFNQSCIDDDNQVLLCVRADARPGVTLDWVGVEMDSI